MAELGPTQRTYRASCSGVEIRLRVNPDSAWLTVKRPGNPADYIDIAPREVDGVVERFTLIAGSSARFDEFVRNALPMA